MQKLLKAASNLTWQKRQRIQIIHAHNICRGQSERDEFTSQLEYSNSDLQNHFCLAKWQPSVEVEYCGKCCDHLTNREEPGNDLDNHKCFILIIKTKTPQHGKCIKATAKYLNMQCYTIMVSSSKVYFFFFSLK